VATPEDPQAPLAECLIALAGTPDDSSWIESQLVAIAQLSADIVTPVSYASVTACRDGDCVTVAASSEVAIAVDKAQYTDRAGPCLDALGGGSPVPVPDIAATRTWPGYRDAAADLGLRASLSIPLFAARGTPIAALNLYAHDSAAMVPVTAAVLAAHGADPAAGAPDGQYLSCGGAGLVAGLAGAFAVRGLIRSAIEVVARSRPCSADGAYLTLRVRAAESGVPLMEIAAATIADGASQ
jgi:hypothetical protein